MIVIFPPEWSVGTVCTYSIPVYVSVNSQWKSGTKMCFTLQYIPFDRSKGPFSQVSAFLVTLPVKFFLIHGLYAYEYSTVLGTELIDVMRVLLDPQIVLDCKQARYCLCFVSRSDQSVFSYLYCVPYKVFFSCCKS